MVDASIPQILPVTVLLMPTLSVTMENVTSRAQLPERPSLDVKLNPPVFVPLNVRASCVEVRSRTRLI